jgi:hypothetical protein
MPTKIGIALFAVVLVLAVLVNAVRAPQTASLVVPPGNADARALPASTSTTARTGLQAYRSNALDLSFSYNASDTGVLEEGDTLYVYPFTVKPTEGQWIKRFSKLSSETLAQSIGRQILAGFSTSTCSIEITAGNRGYERAEISYPLPAGPNESPLGHEAQCNEKYDKTNGIRFFLYDPNHPDRFYFLSIGQYPILAASGTAWQDTIKIGR